MDERIVVCVPHCVPSPLVSSSLPYHVDTLSSTVAASSISYSTSSSSTSLSRRHYQLKGIVGKVSEGYILIRDVRG